MAPLPLRSRCCMLPRTVRRSENRRAVDGKAVFGSLERNLPHSHGQAQSCRWCIHSVSRGEGCHCKGRVARDESIPGGMRFSPIIKRQAVPLRWDCPARNPDWTPDRSGVRGDGWPAIPRSAREGPTDEIALVPRTCRPARPCKDESSGIWLHAMTTSTTRD